MGQVGKVVPEGPSEEVTFVFILATSHGILVFGTGTESQPLALEMWSVNYWIAREVPKVTFVMKSEL